MLKWGFCSLILEKYELNLALKCLEYNKSVQSYGAEVEYEFPFLQCQRLKKQNTFSHVLNLVGVNGGGGSRTHDAQVTRRTLYKRSYGGNDEIRSCDFLSHQAHNFHAVNSSFSTDFKHHTQTLHKSVKPYLFSSSGWTFTKIQPMSLDLA